MGLGEDHAPFMKQQWAVGPVSADQHGRNRPFGLWRWAQLLPPERALSRLAARPSGTSGRDVRAGHGSHGREDGVMTTAVADVPLADIDLSDVDFWLQPGAYREGAFRTLRREAPVRFFAEREFPPVPAGPGYWSLTRYDDI